MITRKPILQSVRLLDQVTERVRYLHYSLSTKKTYINWINFTFVGMGEMVQFDIRAKWVLLKLKLE